MSYKNPPKEHQFKKGQSGNPKGKPPGIPNAKTRYLRLLTLTEKIKNPVTGEMEEFSIMEQLDMQLIAKARRGEIVAYKEIMDRLEGKAPQNLEHPDQLNVKFEVINRVPQQKD